MQQAREISDRFTDLMNAHDLAGLAALFADDGIYIDPTGEYRGRDAITQYWAEFFKAFPDLRVQDDFKAESGDTAINEWSIFGTHTGPLDGPEGTIAATGKSLAIRGCDAVTARDGQIQSQRAYYDQMTFLVQLGLVPEGAATSS